MMETMLEGIARAICLSLSASPDTVDVMMNMRGDEFREAARLALSAMRTPTPAMAESLQYLIDTRGHEQTVEECWASLIDTVSTAG